MQRLRKGDISGYIIDKESWEHLCLPTEYEPKRIVHLYQYQGEELPKDPIFFPTAIGFTDPRTKEGELLWPDRFGEAEVQDARTTMGSYGFAGQHQQRPAPKGGGVFK